MKAFKGKEETMTLNDAKELTLGQYEDVLAYLELMRASDSVEERTEYHENAMQAIGKLCAGWEMVGVLTDPGEYIRKTFMGDGKYKVSVELVEVEPTFTAMKGGKDELWKSYTNQKDPYGSAGSR